MTKCCLEDQKNKGWKNGASSPKFSLLWSPKTGPSPPVPSSPPSFQESVLCSTTWFCLYLCQEVMAHFLVVVESWFRRCLLCVHFLAILLKIEHQCSVFCSCTYTTLFTIQYIAHLLYLGVLFVLLSVFLTIGLLYREWNLKKNQTDGLRIDMVLVSWVWD